MVELRQRIHDPLHGLPGQRFGLGQVVGVRGWEKLSTIITVQSDLVERCTIP